MEHLPAFGREVRTLLTPTYQAYTPLLQKQAAQIKSTAVQTFQYGPHKERHKLDLYTPAVNNNTNSILMFFYGGGFLQGDRIIPDIPDGLVYANVGHYFADHLGFPVAVVDYRQLNHGAKFPSGGEDIEHAVKWISQRFAGSEPLSVYMMGNSAGGLCITDFICASDFVESRKQFPAALKGVIFLSVPLCFDPGSATRKVAEKYYGDNIESNSPLQLLQAAKETLRSLPMMFLAGSLDTDDVLHSYAKLTELSRSIKMEVRMLVGHNHISASLGLGTGIASEEELGRAVIDFIAM